MQRRDFLKLTAAVSMANALPLWSRAVFAASRPALPVPSLLTADARNRIALTIRAGKTQFGGMNATTWGYNGSLLGPALQLTQGRPSRWTLLTSWQKRPRCTGMVWRSRARSTGTAGGYRPGRHSDGELHANATGGHLLVSPPSARDHRSAGGDGAGGAGADRG